MNINTNIVNRIATRDKGCSVYHQTIEGAYTHNIVYSNKLYNNIFKSVEFIFHFWCHSISSHDGLFYTTASAIVCEIIYMFF
jgi:hypothetical protein